MNGKKVHPGFTMAQMLSQLGFKQHDAQLVTTALMLLSEVDRKSTAKALQMIERCETLALMFDPTGFIAHYGNGDNSRANKKFLAALGELINLLPVPEHVAQPVKEGR